MLPLALFGVVSALAGLAVWWGGDRSSGDWQWTLPVALVYGAASFPLARRAPVLTAAFSLMALSAGLSLLAGELAEGAAEGHAVGVGALAVWFSSWTWLPSYVLLLAVVPHLLPEGRVLPGLHRWGFRLGVSAAAVSTLAWLVCPYDELDEASDAALALGVTNPVGVPGAGVLVAAGLVLTLAAAASGLLSLVVRWHRGSDRHSLNWALGGAAVTAGLLVASLAVPGGSPVLMGLAVLPLPAALVLGTAATATRLDSQLRAAQAALAMGQERQRNQLRHDLHDSLGPTLAGVALQLEGLSAVVESQPRLAAAVADRLTLQVQEAVAEVRRLVEGLGPEISLGLAEALRQQVDGFDAPTLRSTLHVEPASLQDLPVAVEVVTVRVVREALSNAARHAGGDSCSVHVDRDDRALRVLVRDNGVGLTAARTTQRTSGTGVGLLSMSAVAQQIGGTCTVQDAPGGGTDVRLVLPLQQS
jgi:signal transduction histidine kinase